jgi:Probable Zinc-ribbon domain
MSLLDRLHVLPFRVRPVHLETIESYARRLLTRNWLHPRSLIRLADAELRASSEQPARRQLIADLIRRLGGTRPNQFDYSQIAVGHPDGSNCKRCLLGHTKRIGCRRCALDVHATQVGHFGHNVCLRHKLWIGADTDGAGQHAVQVRVLRADRKFTRLLHSGRIDPVLYCDLRAVLRRSMQAVGRHDKRTDSSLYPELVALASLVTSSDVLPRLRRCSSFEEAHSLLREMVSVITEEDRVTIVTDGIWLILREGFLRIRETHTQIDPSPMDPHNHIIAVDPRPSALDHIPFPEYLAALKTSAANRWTDFTSKRFHASHQATHRWGLSQRYALSFVAICESGHRMASSITPAVLAKAFQRGTNGCAVCVGLQLLPGANGLDQYPDLARQWDYEKNSESDLRFVPTAGTRKSWWICDRGHSFQRSASERIRKPRCTICRAGLLTDYAPETAKDWDDEKNRGESVRTVSAGSNKLANWKCASGHEQIQTPKARVRSGCLVCTGLLPVLDRAEPTAPKGHRWLIVGETDVASVRPELVDQWHPDNVGSLAEYTIGSQQMVKWVCELGHEWETTVHHRASRTSGCPTCANRRILVGFNDLESQRPLFAKCWDFEGNDGLTPQQVILGTKRMVSWRCLAGHVYKARLDNTVNKSGPPEYCAKHRPPKKQAIRPT